MRLQWAGGDFDPWLDDQHKVNANAPVMRRPASVLRFGERRHGARAYLAVAEGGGHAADAGQRRATHVTSALGGWQGRHSKRGDQLFDVLRHTDGQSMLATFETSAAPRVCMSCAACLVRMSTASVLMRLPH